MVFNDMRNICDLPSERPVLTKNRILFWTFQFINNKIRSFFGLPIWQSMGILAKSIAIERDDFTFVAFYIFIH